MNFSSLYQPKNNQSQWIDVIRYFFSSLLVAAIFCYLVFVAKAYLLQQQINVLDQGILAQSTPAQNASEARLQGYKKEIADYAALIDSHSVSSNLFNFIEEKTLPDVSFSSLTLSETKNDLQLVGQADTMAALSNQINIFEENKDDVKNIDVLNSSVVKPGKITFTLDISLNPDIFSFR
jgi:hypothetical protein